MIEQCHEKPDMNGAVIALLLTDTALPLMPTEWEKLWGAICLYRGVWWLCVRKTAVRKGSTELVKGEAFPLLQHSSHTLCCISISVSGKTES